MKLVLFILCTILIILGMMLSDLKSLGEETVTTNPDGTYTVIKDDGTREHCVTIGEGPTKTVICR